MEKKNLDKLPQTSTSAFKSSGFGILADSATSGFGALGSTGASVFGGGKPFTGGFESFAAPEKLSGFASPLRGTDADGTSALAFSGSTRTGAPTLGFGGSGGGGFATGISAFGGGTGNGFAGGSGPKLSSFAAPLSPEASGAPSKAPKAFGAPDSSGDDESENEDRNAASGEENGAESGTKVPAEDKKKFKTKGISAPFAHTALVFLWAASHSFRMPLLGIY